MTDDVRARALVVRLWLACLATQELLTAYLGLRLGLYAALRGNPATYEQLARAAGIAPRYAREWLEQQAVAGFIDVDDATLPAPERTYSIDEGHATVLTASDDPLSLASLAILPLGGVARALPELLAAYRSGGGVPDAVFGDDWREGHSGANRALFTHQLAGWVRRALPGAHQRLRTPGARIADIGCGAGWASIALAQAYPHAQVDGFDLDAAATADAARNAEEAGVGDRVSFHARDAADPGAAGRYDLVCVLDVLHEVPRPVEMLRTCRELRRDGGSVLVMDARVAPAFVAPADEVERFQYATSLLHCLPACLAAEDSAGTGTVMRPDQVRGFARAAGFADAQVLPVQERFHRLYHLTG
ncbi:class I SAM-dependent methyltransferase [Luedemannella helvata]|uniref:Class I SAM-dependent methyltransferase n=1 Tax=Luedemannella helvata TaxID=349315 RepID=A0ABP4X1B1_9ACTN